MNKYQTVFTDDDFATMPKEVKVEYYEVLESIPFVNWLVQPESIRGFAKDRPKHKDLNIEDERRQYNDGRIVVDITKPHILENMDFFRERAIFFDKHGKYTDIVPNPNPKSDWKKFWKQEVIRWRDGVIRESDGEWIPGGLYFYWNYCPIWITSETNKVGKKTGKTKGERVRKFPNPWLGDYLFYHYIEQAREQGKHGKLLKTRGIGYSFKMGSLSPRNMYIYEGSGNPNFHLASDKTFLTGDKGVFGKVLDTLDWIANNTPLPKLRLIDGKKAMEIQLGYLDDYGTRQGLLSSVYGISMKDNPDKARGIRGPLIHYEEDGVFPNLEDTWNINRKATEDGDVAFGFQLAGGCVCAGTKVWTKNGRLINIEDLKQEDGILGFDVEEELNKPQTISYMQLPTEKECVEIHTDYRILRCSIDHPILTRGKHYENTKEVIGIRRDYYKGLDKWYESPKYKTIGVYAKHWKNASELVIGDKILVSEKIDLWGNEELFDSRLVGMLIGDGSYGMRRHYNKIEYKTPAFSNCDNELVQYVLNNYSCNIELQRPTKDGRIYYEISIRNLIPRLKQIGIAGQSKTQKRLPINYMSLTKKDTCLLLAGLFDTDGYISKKGINISQANIDILLQIKVLLEKLGIQSIIRKVEPRISPNRKDKNPWYNLTISRKKSIINFYENIPILIQYKKDMLEIIKNKAVIAHRVNNTFKNIVEERIIKIEYIGKQPIYNLTADENNTYLANNIITHNTGGSEGSDFTGSEKLFYDPDTYNIYGLPNVFDKNSNGQSKCGFFWGAYLNRNKCYDLKTGEPNVTKAIIEVLLDRFKVKNGLGGSKAITQKRAEEPFTPQDAIMRVEGTIFPVAELKDYLAEISPNMARFVAPHYTGTLIPDSDGTMKLVLANGTLTPIREFPATENKVGCIEIFEVPARVKDNYRYILGIDTYDDDEVTYSNSLGSAIVFDRWTRRIVAEYTGRPETANAFYEIVYRLAIYYNATIMYENNKKGLYGYFQMIKKNIGILADTPEFILDKQTLKPRNVSNNTTKGINATAAINAYGRRLQVDWMLENAYEEEMDLDDMDNPKPTTNNIHKIRSIGYIKECIAWNADINCDRVSAMSQVMLYDMALTEYGTKTSKEKSNTLANDKFFNRKYRSRHVMNDN